MKPRKSVYLLFFTQFLQHGHDIRGVSKIIYLLCLVTEERQTPLDGLAGLSETRVQECFVLGDFQHRDLGLTDQ